MKHCTDIYSPYILRYKIYVHTYTCIYMYVYSVYTYTRYIPAIHIYIDIYMYNKDVPTAADLSRSLKF